MTDEMKIDVGAGMKINVSRISVEGLPTLNRIVFCLRYTEGLTVPEISEVLGRNQKEIEKICNETKSAIFDALNRAA